MKKILIIKLGFSETLSPNIETYPSLGDVLRTTPILHAVKEKFPESHITWLVSEEAKLLLDCNRYIDRMLVWDSFVGFQLMREQFDVVINLEKIAGLCALADMINAWTKYGFRFDEQKGSYHAYERGLDFLDYMNNGTGRNCWQKLLVEMIGVEWKSQPYILDYKPKTGVTHDVGLNYLVGSKWPNKAMGEARWQELHDMLTEAGFSVSWQQGKKDLHEYMDWINSCRLLLSQDSLGIHIALAQGKKVVSLFGPTDPDEIHLYDSGVVIKPDTDCDKLPCYMSVCSHTAHCMGDISLKEVVEQIKGLM